MIASQKPLLSILFCPQQMTFRSHPNMGCFVLRPKLSPRFLSLIVFTFLTEDVPLEVPANAYSSAKDARQGDDHDGGHHQQDPHPHHRHHCHHCHRDFTFSVRSISHGTCHKQLTETSKREREKCRQPAVTNPPSLWKQIQFCSHDKSSSNQQERDMLARRWLKHN